MRTDPFPRRVGRYQLLLPIAAGGMATVYLGRATGVAGFAREVAVKVLHPHLTLEDGALVDPLDEARVAGRIRHPNVVGVLDIGESERGPYLVMEYVEGPTLARMMRDASARGSPIPIAIALRVLTDLLQGLAAAHDLRDDAGVAMNLVHRDVSPQNVLVGIDGVSRLTDFGIAKVANREGATATGIVKGKAGYMAPEQLRGGTLDGRCDVWAAGVIAWELLVGRRLFVAADPVAAAMKIIEEPILAPHLERAAVPEALGEVVLSALRRPLGERLGSASAFLAALRTCGSPIADVSEVASYVAKTFATETDAFRARARDALAATSEDVSGAVEIVPGGATEATVEIATTSRQNDVTSPSSGGRARSIWIAVGATALVSVAVASLVRVGAAPSAATSAPSSIGPASSARAANEPSSSESSSSALASTSLLPTTAAAPDATAATSSSRPSIRVRADAPIAAIRVGTRLVNLAVPANDVTLELLESEGASATRIELVGRDGRRALVKLGDLGEMVRFPSPVRRGTGKSEPLMSTPYGKP